MLHTYKASLLAKYRIGWLLFCLEADKWHKGEKFSIAAELTRQHSQMVKTGIVAHPSYKNLLAHIIAPSDTDGLARLLRAESHVHTFVNTSSLDTARHFALILEFAKYMK